MLNLNNDLSELVKSHISIYSDLSNSSLYVNQLDFLSFWVSPSKMANKSPFDFRCIRDNPNWELTQFENVYQLVEDDKIVLQYVRDWFSPVAILQWYRMNIKWNDKWKISVYWKWLRLYYCWFLDWLPDYIDYYCDVVIRADLCWDTPHKIPPSVVDLSNTITYWEEENRTYKWFWNKRSPLFIRIYDKTLDLKKDHDCMAWLYPERYTNSCRRLECKFTWRYAQSMSALAWLGLVARDWQVQKNKSPKRDYLKSAFYNMLMYVDFLPNKIQQVNILNSVKELCERKLKKLSDFISVNDVSNEKI